MRSLLGTVTLLGLIASAVLFGPGCATWEANAEKDCSGDVTKLRCTCVNNQNPACYPPLNDDPVIPMGTKRPDAGTGPGGGLSSTRCGGDNATGWVPSDAPACEVPDLETVDLPLSPGTFCEVDGIAAGEPFTWDFAALCQWI